MARALVISPHTVQGHPKPLVDEVGVRRRATRRVLSAAEAPA